MGSWVEGLSLVVRSLDDEGKWVVAPCGRHPQRRGLGVGLPVKSVLEGEAFTITRNWPTQKGVVPSRSGRPQVSENQIQNLENVACTQATPAISLSSQAWHTFKNNV